MSGPRLNAAYYAAPVAEFLRAAESEVYAPLASPHGYTLAPEQLSAWRLQLPVLRAALAGLDAAAPAPWIHLEFDMPRRSSRSSVPRKPRGATAGAITVFAGRSGRT